jgi:hypothetical protein
MLTELVQAKLDAYDSKQKVIADNAKSRMVRAVIAQIGGDFTRVSARLEVTNYEFDGVTYESITGRFDGVSFELRNMVPGAEPALMYHNGNGWQSLNTEAQFKVFAKWYLGKRVRNG